MLQRLISILAWTLFTNGRFFKSWWFCWSWWAWWSWWSLQTWWSWSRFSFCQSRLLWVFRLKTAQPFSLPLHALFLYLSDLDLDEFDYSFDFDGYEILVSAATPTSCTLLSELFLYTNSFMGNINKRNDPRLFFQLFQWYIDCDMLLWQQWHDNQHQGHRD